jgi:RNA polymerase sigma-70 factor, ECF subfamily
MNSGASAKRSQQFTEDLRQCQAGLLRYIFALVRNGEDAQDVFQQTCLTLWEKYDDFDRSRNFMAWACGVARFKVRKFQSQGRRRQIHFSDAFARRLADVQAGLKFEEPEARRSALPGCIEKLPPSQRELLSLCYGGEQRVAEVAEKLGRSASSVHNSLKTIREKLLDCIERAVREDER